MIEATPKERAAVPGEVEAALENANCNTDCSADRVLAQAGKSLAVWLFNIEARSLDETNAVFRQHSEWRAI